MTSERLSFSNVHSVKHIFMINDGSDIPIIKSMNQSNQIASEGS